MSQSIDVIVEASWQAAHPGAHVGLLALSRVEPEQSRLAGFAARREALEAELRRQFAGKSRADLLTALPELRVYAGYYRRFKKTYHVQLQLESVAFKGRDLSGGLPLVTATFMAELQSRLLTATHDLDAVRPPLRLLAAGGEERYAALNGEEVQAKAGDMLMADASGAICTVIAGQSRQSSVRPETRRALFVVYAPAGIAAEGIQQHLGEIERLVHLFAPAASVDDCRVIAVG